MTVQPDRVVAELLAFASPCDAICAGRVRLWHTTHPTRPMAFLGACLWGHVLVRTLYLRNSFFAKAVASLNCVSLKSVCKGRVQVCG